MSPHSNLPVAPHRTAPRGRSLALRAAVVLLLAGGALFLAWPSLGETLTERVARPFVLEPLARQRVGAFEPELRVAAAAAGVEPALLAGLVLAESSGRVDAKSRANALGLCQLMLPTAKEWARRLDLEPPTEERLRSDAAYNLRLGAAYLAWLIERRDGNVEAALVAYNAGPMALTRREREHGSYAAWREVAAATGRSELLAYAAKVQGYRDAFLRRGLFVPEPALLLAPDPAPRIEGQSPSDGRRTVPE